MKRLAAAVVTLAASTTAGAHSFGRLYNLPVPLWLYLYGAAAALLASFLLMAWLARPAATELRANPPWSFRWPRSTGCLRWAQALSLSMLALAIWTGLAGSQDAYRNFNMTGFWIGFVLGFAYLVALLGNGYATINPWWLIVRGLEHATGPRRSQLRDPGRFGVWPALVLYMGFIWLELFGATTPRTLSWMLLAYTVINLFGAWLLGTRAWFRQGEFFAVFLRLIGACAPLQRVGDRMVLRWPFARLATLPIRGWSMVVFVLFMLSSTAFDGLRETLPWFRLFWQDLHALVWTHWYGEDRVASYAAMSRLYAWWQTAALWLSPVLYLAAYLLALQGARLLTGERSTLTLLARRFAPSLLPIALAYHVTHYYTLLLTQGRQLPWLLADPFGSGHRWAWRWIGPPPTHLPDAGVVWHVQVALIVAGHIAGVVVAHRIALRTVETRRAATLSQLPMLVLMLLYTASGLWILAQPLNPGGH